MSDLFDSLVARARGLEPEVVPRVPGLFEAPAVGGPPEGDPVKSVVNADLRRRDEPSYAVPRDPGQLRVPPTPEPGAALHADVRRRDEPSYAAPPDPGQLRVRPTPEPGAAILPATPRTADRVTKIERHVVRETVPTRDVESAGGSPELLLATLEHGPAPVPVQAPVEGGDVGAPAPTRLDESGLVQAGFVDAPSVAVRTTTQTSVRSEPNSAELRAETPQRVRAVVSATQPHVPATAATPTEPTIHVTIGRVEIRAVPEVPPAPAPRTDRRRTQSLDEYLAERNQRRQA
jgi:hypothetical protein